jgi:hypothetical protein
LFDNLEPNKNIVNVIIYCKPDEQAKMEEEFNAKRYPVDYKVVVQGDDVENLTDALKDYTSAAQGCTFNQFPS